MISENGGLLSLLNKSMYDVKGISDNIILTEEK